MDLRPCSPEDQLRLETEAGLLCLPGFAPHSAAFAGRALVFPHASHGLANNGHSSPRQQRRALSQTTLAPPPPMHRNMSNRSEPVMPAHGPRAPVPAPGGRRVGHEMLAAAPLPRVCEDPPLPDVGMTPDAFIATYLSSTGTNLSPQDMFSSNTLSAPPSMISASSAAEAPHPMTRENSYVYTSPGISMVSMASYTAHTADALFGQAMSPFQPPEGSCKSSWKSSDLDHALLAIGDSFSFPASQQYAAAENQALLSPTCALMEREDSAASVESTRSTASHVQRRAKAARERVLQASQTTSIAPMPRALPRSAAPPPAACEGRTLHEGGRAKQRPRPPKLQCSQCSEYPEGFRGDHELRRHVSAKHVDVVKKFVCRDPAEAGIHTELKVLYPLSRCKACASGKQYGAYYNAAAHLRRTHFRVRPSRGKARAPMSERRGGRGGGDWPPMAELKAWFQEVLVPGDGSFSLGAGGDDPPDDDSISLEAEEALFEPASHMDSNPDPLGCGDIYGSFYGHDFSPSDMPTSYVDQSGQAAGGLAMMSELSDRDIDSSASSQESVASYPFPNMENVSFDDLWMMRALTPI